MANATSSTNKGILTAVGIVIALVAVVLLNVVAGMVRVRKDMTADKLYTLTDGTENILQKIDTPVTLRFYVTKDERTVPEPLQNFARFVEDTLIEYKKRAPEGMINVEVLNPEPDTEEEDSANLDGIQAQGELYFGIAVSCLDQKTTIPFLPARAMDDFGRMTQDGLQEAEALLEYDLSRAITQVISPKKPKVGVMSALSVTGGPGAPPTFRPTQPWIFYAELQRDFDVQEVPLDSDSIPDGIDVLVVLHPGGISEQTEYAIDQYVLKGGKVIAFLDAFSLAARRESPQQGPMPQQPESGPPTSSTFNKLLSAWGYSFESTQVVADMTYLTVLQGDKKAPTAPTLTGDAINDENPATAQLNDVWMVLPGGFTGKPADGLSAEVLMHSSTDTQLVSSFQAEALSDDIVNKFESSNTKYDLAILLSGKFKSAFPSGKPADAAAEEEDGAEEGEGGEKAADSGHLKEAEAEGSVVLVADSDLLFDDFCVRIMNFLGQRIASPRNSNLVFFQNMVEQLGGDPNLLKVRSRGSLRRPFTTINEMEEQAQAEYRDKLDKLEEERREAEQKINELQRQKPQGDQQFVMTPEQQAEMQRFSEKRAKASKDLRELRKELNAKITLTKDRIKIFNIALVPLVVFIGGGVYCLIRWLRTGAR